jgi:hypothetical protein
MEPMDAVPPGNAVDATDARRAPARTRAVVALVRPCRPNVAVVTAAADLAARHGAALLVLGTLDPLTCDWVDGVDIAGPMLSAAHGELFATCVETLWDRSLVWGVEVLWGRVAAETVSLAERVDVVRVVRGQRHSDTVWRRLRRRLSGRLDDMLRELDIIAV